MARQITQETFDAAVLENIELLEMSPEDAVLEAVQQFEAQVLTLFWNMVYTIEHTCKKLNSIMFRNCSCCCLILHALSAYISVTISYIIFLILVIIGNKYHKNGVKLIVIISRGICSENGIADSDSFALKTGKTTFKQ